MTISEAREILLNYKMPLTADQLILYKQALKVVSTLQIPEAPND